MSRSIIAADRSSRRMRCRMMVRRMAAAGASSLAVTMSGANGIRERIGVRAFAVYLSPSGPQPPLASYQSHPPARCPMTARRMLPMYTLAGWTVQTEEAGWSVKRDVHPSLCPFLCLSCACPWLCFSLCLGRELHRLLAMICRNLSLHPCNSDPFALAVPSRAFVSTSKRLNLKRGAGSGRILEVSNEDGDEFCKL